MGHFHSEICPTQRNQHKDGHTTCEITFPTTPKEKVASFVLWNGKGVRARWAGKCELKEVVHATNPDLLCFLEAKTDAENLRKLKGFEELAVQQGYCKFYC